MAKLIIYVDDGSETRCIYPNHSKKKDLNTQNESIRNFCNVYWIVAQQQKYLTSSHHFSKIKSSSSSEAVSSQLLCVAMYLNGREISEQDS